MARAWEYGTRIHNTWPYSCMANVCPTDKDDRNSSDVNGLLSCVDLHREGDKHRRYHLVKLQNVEWWSLLLAKVLVVGTEAIEATATGMNCCALS